MKKISIIIVISLLMVASEVSSAEESHNNAYLVSYEPNLLGVTYDQDDKELFMDFKLSLQYPILRNSFKGLVNKSWYPQLARGICSNRFVDSCYPYFSFTGRFGQYLFTRDSAPVIGKRFNPKIFIRLEKGESYLDIEYAHESNGQRITSFESYSSLASDLGRKDESYHANDYISRGWDYMGATLKYHYPLKGGNDRNLNFYLSYSKYIDGYLQGGIEEYFDWEQRRKIEAREEVSGWKLIVKASDEKALFLPIVHKVALIYQTGIKSPFKYNTTTIEITSKSLDLPIMVWGRWGYSSDLAQYYKEVDSYGIALELKTFE